MSEVPAAMRDMRHEVQKRVEELTGEYEAGQKMLAELDAKRAELQQTVLRISGALQVLTELLGQESQEQPAAGAQIGETPDNRVFQPVGS